MRCNLILPPAALAAALLTAPAVCAPGDGDPLPDRVLQAHRDLDRAHIVADYTIYFSYPDETEFVSTHYEVWLDRATRRLRIDRPGFTLICDGQTVYLRSERIPGRHLEVPLADGLTYDALVRLVPDVNDPVPPALTMLLADTPMMWLSAGHAPSADALKPRDDDPAARPRLRLPTQLGDLTFSCESGTLLLDDVVLVADDKQLEGSGLVDARFHYGLAIEPSAEPYADAVFEFETDNSQAVGTMAELLAPPRNPNAPQGNNPGGQTLIDVTLPDVELAVLDGDEPINLSTLDEGVVILEFFATWTRPSLTDLGDLVAYQDWAEEEGHDIRVFAVNVLEKSKQVREWLALLSEQTGVEYDLPVLLDVNGQAAMTLGLPTVPRTVIFVDGRIVSVFGGIKPGFGQALRDATPGWLGEGNEAEGEDEPE